MIVHGLFFCLAKNIPPIKELKKQNMPYSLHTEYSYKPRMFDTAIIKPFKSIIESELCGVPELWKSEKWAKEFTKFIVKLVDKNDAPSVIEIHPPFNSYSDIKTFIRIYEIFEEEILEKYPNVDIQIENRTGSMYRKGEFLFSKLKDLELLVKNIEKNKLKLRIACDIPQFFTAERSKNENEYISVIKEIKNFSKYINGVHLWGKKYKSSAAHMGDLNDYFGKNVSLKKKVINEINNTFNDGRIRNLVLEVNSKPDDLYSIIKDLKENNICF